MAKLSHSIETRITGILALLIGAMIIFGVHYIFRDAKAKETVKAQIQNRLKAVAETVADRIDGDAYAALKSGDEGKPAYEKIRKMLYEMQTTLPDVKYVYTMNIDSKGVLVWAIDSEWGISKEPVKIGEPVEVPGVKMKEGFSKAVAEEDYYTDEWGTFLSGYAPIRDSKGKVVGAVGVDITSKSVMSKQDVLGTIINITLFLTVMALAILIVLLTRGMINDLERLNKAANEISTGRMDVDVGVRRSDEIGNLAESFGRMAASLKVIMSEEQGGKK